VLRWNLILANMRVFVLAQASLCSPRPPLSRSTRSPRSLHPAHFTPLTRCTRCSIAAQPLLNRCSPLIFPQYHSLGGKGLIFHIMAMSTIETSIQGMPKHDRTGQRIFRWPDKATTTRLAQKLEPTVCRISVRIPRVVCAES
jgi:hypothetical protein